jgi:hypothetical protein
MRTASGLIYLLALAATGAISEMQAQAPSAAPKASNEAAIVLGPFEVREDAKDTYQALNTSSISGTNRSLETLPITAEIFNATMMKDLGTSDVADGGSMNNSLTMNTVVHVHDLHATLLHLFGIDHERLTYRFQGRRYRLTDVHGRVISALLA